MLSRLSCLRLFLSVFAVIHSAGAQTGLATDQVTILLRSDRSWDGSKYHAYPKGEPELTVLKIEIPPHTTLPWHTHPMPNVAYVLSGTLHVQTEEGGHEVILGAGDVLPETVGIIHRGWTEESAVELVVFYAGVKDMPTAQKAK